VKIKGTCKAEGREFLVEQVVAAGGHCPWGGESFEPDYAVVLVDALRDAEEAGTRLETALDKVADIHPAFLLDQASVLGPLRAVLERLDRNIVTRG
jgi:hypothetical protein